MHAFEPDWASAPGETILDVMSERKLSEAALAELIGLTITKLRELLEGRATISLALARRLSSHLGASVEFWMSRDYQYRQDIARVHELHEQWLAELPIGDMIRWGWLNPSPHPRDEVDACLRFFSVPDISAWNKAYSDLHNSVAFRTSQAIDSTFGSVAAWLRKGEIEAETISCKAWDPKRFKETLSKIRSLTREKEPGRFIPKLQAACAGTGVAVVIVRSPTGCRASGATRFLSSQKALLQLSFRYLTDDHFWFSFFHEAGHLLLHGEQSIFLESADLPSNDREEDANLFAERIIIPEDFRDAFMHIPLTKLGVMRFAGRNNLAALLFWLERTPEPADLRRGINRLVEMLSGPEDGELRSAFAAWLQVVRLPGDGLTDVDIPEVLGLEEFRTMLAKRVEEWNQVLLERGREEGRQEGEKRGEAKVLLRQLEVKFGAIDARTRLRIQAAGPKRLLQWAERVVTAKTLSEVFAR